MKTLLSINDLSAWYIKDKPVIRHLSFDIEPNTVTGLLGLNGAGKTTLLNTLCGLHEGSEAANISFAGNKADLRSNELKKKRYAVFSEDDSLEYFTFDEYLNYVFKAYGKTADTSETDRLVSEFNFQSYRSVLLKELSMGNKRKAYLITAFALRPELLLLDEPVNGLDFQSTEALYAQISAYRKYGSILFSSHVLESVTLTCDKVCILEDGRISRTFTGGEITPENIRSVLRFEGDEADV